MLKDVLSKETCKELRDKAKELNISGRWDMTKEQLIDECRGGQELILAALKLFQKLFKKVCTNSK